MYTSFCIFLITFYKRKYFSVLISYAVFMRPAITNKKSIITVYLYDNNNLKGWLAIAKLKPLSLFISPF